MLLVVRREGGKLRRYVHLATGNYHAGTARAYTDIGLMTAHPDIGSDVHQIFQQVSGLAPAIKLKRLLQAPFTLHAGIIDKIGREAKHARAGRVGHIIAKMNALTEPMVIRALYEASQAGVKIELIVRGACALRPGVAGISDNITVRSVVGRFLEHTRISWFFNNGHPELYCASADWMDRNLLRRVEISFPILDPVLAKRVYDEGLANYLADNTSAWALQGDGSYRRIECGADDMPHNAQTHLLNLMRS
jgi:polyphosphate kinase